MKQSTDDLAKFKPSQTLTLNIALGSGSIAGAGKRSVSQHCIRRTLWIEEMSLVKPAVTSKGLLSQRTVGKGSLFSEDSKVQPKPTDFRRRKITFNVQERLFSFHEVAVTEKEGR